MQTEGRPRLCSWLDRLAADRAAVVYGYFRAYSDGNDMVGLDEIGNTERARFSFPRRRQERRLCLADSSDRAEQVDGATPVDLLGAERIGGTADRGAPVGAGAGDRCDRRTPLGRRSLQREVSGAASVAGRIMVHSRPTGSGTGLDSVVTLGRYNRSLDPSGSP